MEAVKKVDGALAAFSKLLCFIGALIIMFQMCLIVVDVVLRTFFSSTVVGASIMARNALIAGVFLGLPYVTFHNAHTRAEVFYTNGSPKRKYAMDILTAVVGVIVFALMSYSLINPTKIAISSHQFDSEGRMLLPLAPFYICVLFGAVFSLYAAIRNLILTISGGLGQYGKEAN